MTDDADAFTLTAMDVARRIGFSHDRVTAWAKEGLISYMLTPGGHYRFRPADVDQFVANRTRTAGES